MMEWSDVITQILTVISLFQQSVKVVSLCNRLSRSTQLGKSRDSSLDMIGSRNGVVEEVGGGFLLSPVYCCFHVVGVIV